MLPKFRTAAVALIAATSLGLTSMPALAWGKKEQGFVAGVATAVIVDQLIQNGQHRRQHNQPGYYQPPQYVAPPPAYVPPPAPTYRPHRPAPQTYNSVHATPAGQAFRTYSVSERKAIQRQLRRAGYYYGSIDGTFGTGTYNAITAWARDSGASANLRSTGGAFAVYDGLLF
ncbi:peptidoglycan-binding protein [Xinfangfangia sp. D13-10-4-6]|uniref:peptidoglycan-binding domain-containing protein n=1 Tax=Pseudogemmobacter hezensis TaxID=2737662 RepID=UPI00155264DE|nr:peptidoglycan-binding domain-containing protein [Pseudogemmobacter hezensis]NPD14645.1 peptidoglycan-binding protein [Pseudogemmobacter hezensis]